MYVDPKELAERLREEVLKNYTPGVPNSPYPDVHNTLNFFMFAYAERGMVRTVILPMKLMQLLCSLANDGFEIAAGYRYKNEKNALESLLDQIWYLFTITLVRWVKGRKKTRINGEKEDFYYGCYEVPRWFIQAAKETHVNGAYKDHAEFDSP
jgi:hypothetical protein